MKKKIIMFFGLMLAIIFAFNSYAFSDDPMIKSCLQDKAYYSNAKSVITGTCWDNRGSSMIYVGPTQKCAAGTELCTEKKCEGDGCVFQSPPTNPPN